MDDNRTQNTENRTENKALENLNSITYGNMKQHVQIEVSYDKKDIQ